METANGMQIKNKAGQVIQEFKFKDSRVDDLEKKVESSEKEITQIKESVATVSEELLNMIDVGVYPIYLKVRTHVETDNNTHNSYNERIIMCRVTKSNKNSITIEFSIEGLFLYFGGSKDTMWCSIDISSGDTKIRNKGPRTLNSNLSEIMKKCRNYYDRDKNVTSAAEFDASIMASMVWSSDAGLDAATDSQPGNNVRWFLDLATQEEYLLSAYNKEDMDIIIEGDYSEYTWGLPTTKYPTDGANSFQYVCKHPVVSQICRDLNKGSVQVSSSGGLEIYFYPVSVVKVQKNNWDTFTVMYDGDYGDSRGSNGDVNKHYSCKIPVDKYVMSLQVKIQIYGQE